MLLIFLFREKAFCPPPRTCPSLRSGTSSASPVVQELALALPFTVYKVPEHSEGYEVPGSARWRLGVPLTPLALFPPI